MLPTLVVLGVSTAETDEDVVELVVVVVVVGVVVVVVTVVDAVDDGVGVEPTAPPPPPHAASNNNGNMQAQPRAWAPSILRIHAPRTETRVSKSARSHIAKTWLILS